MSGKLEGPPKIESSATPEQESEEPLSPEQARASRIAQIDQRLADLLHRVTSDEEIAVIQQEREQAYQKKIQELETGLGQPLSEESKVEIHQNLVDSITGQAWRDNERFDNLQRLKRAADILTPQEFLYFEKILGNQEGKTDQLYDLRGKAMHTTNSFYLEKILAAGSIRTDNVQEGMYGAGTPGASFTDGDFEKAISFQLAWDDQNTRSADKQFNTQRYFDKAENLVRYFWDTKPEETKRYFGKGGGKEIRTFEDVMRIVEGFRSQAKPREIADDLEQLSKLFGVTIAFNKDRLPDLTKDGIEGLQRDFELRSYREGGVPLVEASTIFVPESQIGVMKYKLDEYGLTHIGVRPSEELEVIMMAKILEEER